MEWFLFLEPEKAGFGNEEVTFRELNSSVPRVLKSEKISTKCNGLKLKKIIKISELKLQGLKFTSGWEVKYNVFFDVDPGEDVFVEDAQCSHNPWHLFDEDLLQMVHSDSNLTLDLGWSPPEELKGKYLLTLLETNNWENIFFEFETRSKDELVSKINETMKKVSCKEIKWP